MPLTIVRGPAGAGKSQYVEREHKPGQVIVDFTRLYSALANVARGADGKYPERHDGDPLLPLIAAMKAHAIREAAAREISGYVTTSSSAPGELARLRELGASGPSVTLDPGEVAIRARLAELGTDGKLSPECEKALKRWYRS